MVRPPGGGTGPLSDPGKNPLRTGLAAGEEQAFGLLYDRSAGRLYRAALALLGRPDDAEDAVQETFLGALRSRRSLAVVENLDAYLFTALRRAAGRIAEARRRRAAMPLDTAAAVPVPRAAGALAGIEGDDRMRRALEALPPEQRQAVRLKIEADLTFQEMGAALGIPADTAASRYRYGLERLRTNLASVRNDGRGEEQR